jgi:aryl sulfotransferase
MAALPQRTRVYQCHHLDSTRWDDVVPRPDDIIITTSLKAGTTWTQRIVSLLVFQTVELPKTLHWISPWPDSRFVIPKAEMAAVVEGIPHRRFLKSHLALDALPYWPSTKYIYVGRDTRDVFMSTGNHVRAYTATARQLLSSGENAPSEPFPELPDDIREFWRVWITRGTYPWESDGFPFWSHHHHARSYWDFRHLPNLLFVHYNDGRDVRGDEARHGPPRGRDEHHLRGRRGAIPLQGDERTVARRPDERRPGALRGRRGAHPDARLQAVARARRRLGGRPEIVDHRPAP